MCLTKYETQSLTVGIFQEMRIRYLSSFVVGYLKRCKRRRASPQMPTPPSHLIVSTGS